MENPPLKVGEYLHFMYLKCLVNNFLKNAISFENGVTKNTNSIPSHAEGKPTCMMMYDVFTYMCLKKKLPTSAK